MGVRPQLLPLERDFVVDRCFVLFVRARAPGPLLVLRLLSAGCRLLASPWLC